MLYVIEVSSDAGRDMYWNDWVVIDSDEPREKVEDVFQKLDASPGYDRSQSQLDKEITDTFTKDGLTINSIRHAKCVFFP
jgi:hypothetical protein